MIKLSDWAKKNNISYNTALRWFKQNKLPVTARQMESGTILIDEDYKFMNVSESNEVNIFLKIYNALSNELVYIVNNDKEVKTKLLELSNLIAKSQHTILSNEVDSSENVNDMFTKKELYDDFINIMEKSLNNSLDNPKDDKKWGRVSTAQSNDETYNRVKNNDLVKALEDVFISASHDEDNKNIKMKIVNGYEVPTDPGELTNIPLPKEKLDEWDENKKALNNFVQSIRLECANTFTKEVKDRTERFQNKEKIIKAGEFKRANLNYDEHSESVFEFAKIVCEKTKAIKPELTKENVREIIKDSYAELTDMPKDSYVFDEEFVGQMYNILTCKNNTKDSLEQEISSNTKIREVLLFVFDYPKIQTNIANKKTLKQIANEVSKEKGKIIKKQKPLSKDDEELIKQIANGISTEELLKKLESK